MRAAEQQRQIRSSIFCAQCMGCVWGGILGCLALGFLHAALADPSDPPYQWPWLLGLPAVALACACLGAWLCGRETRKYFLSFPTPQRGVPSPAKRRALPPLRRFLGSRRGPG